MKWLMNLLRGTVTVAVEGVYPERLMNLCAQEGVLFWGIQWEGAHNVTLVTRRKDLKRLRTLAQKLSCTLVVGKGVGLPFFLGRLRYRYAFLAGLALSVCAVVVLSQFVLTIQVVGNERVSTGEILSELERLGLHIGGYGPDLDRVTMAQQAVFSLEELSWMAINRYGTRIEVIVRERVMTPEIREFTGLASVYAQADGIIQSMRVQVGDGMVVTGDIVAEGDLLISGLVELESPEYSELPSIWLEVHAQGEVYARTWRTLEGQIPLKTTVKTPTGQSETVYSLTIFGNTVNFFGSGSIEGGECDKIRNTILFDLPRDITLPLYFTTETSCGYTTQQVEVNMAAAQTLVEEGLVEQLRDVLGEDGTILSTTSQARREGDILYVTLYAECEEEIGETRSLDALQPPEE